MANGCRLILLISCFSVLYPEVRGNICLRNVWVFPNITALSSGSRTLHSRTCSVLLLVYYLACSLTLKMVSLFTSETMYFLLIRHRSNAESSSLHNWLQPATAASLLGCLRNVGLFPAYTALNPESYSVSSHTSNLLLFVSSSTYSLTLKMDAISASKTSKYLNYTAIDPRRPYTSRSRL